MTNLPAGKIMPCFGIARQPNFHDLNLVCSSRLPIPKEKTPHPCDEMPALFVSALSEDISKRDSLAKNLSFRAPIMS
jgi:hypothetical protein